MKRFESPKYKPLPASAVKRILRFDAERGFGPAGNVPLHERKPNKTRFYIWLTQAGSDVLLRTVAVKAVTRFTAPVLKEVVRSSADDPWMHVLDVGCYTMSGYVVDWSGDFTNGKPLSWTYGRQWESTPYEKKSGLWKIHAPVINPELLKKTRRFRWAAWTPACGHLLDYLKMFREHPEIELLSKNGLGWFSTKVSIVRKLKTDRKFRQFFMQNEAVIRSMQFGADVVLKAYCGGVSIDEAFREISARREFRGMALPRCVNATKAKAYLDAMNIWRGDYAKYLNECLKAGLDLADTKVCFPNDFKERERVVKDLADAVRRQENAEATAKLNEQLAAVADQWQWLEKKRGAFRVVLPRTEAEFVAEGKAMTNCLGQYAARVARGELVVVFIRQKSAPEAAFVAASYSVKSNEIMQCYGIKNSKPTKSVSDFVKRLFCGIQSIISRRAVAA